MKNTYMEFVKEWKKKNPGISHIDAMKLARKDYKPKETTKKDNKTTRSREKLTKRYNKVFGNLLYSLNNNKYESDELEEFKEITDKLIGKSETNRYARNRKKIEKLMKNAKPTGKSMKSTTDTSDRNKLIEEQSIKREKEEKKYDNIKRELKKRKQNGAEAAPASGN